MKKIYYNLMVSMQHVAGTSLISVQGKALLESEYQKVVFMDGWKIGIKITLATSYRDSLTPPQRDFISPSCWTSLYTGNLGWGCSLHDSTRHPGMAFHTSIPLFLFQACPHALRRAARAPANTMDMAKGPFPAESAPFKEFSLQVPPSTLCLVTTG